MMPDMILEFVPDQYYEYYYEPFCGPDGLIWHCKDKFDMIILAVNEPQLYLQTAEMICRASFRDKVVLLNDYRDAFHRMMLTNDMLAFFNLPAIDEYDLYDTGAFNSPDHDLIAITLDEMDYAFRNWICYCPPANPLYQYLRRNYWSIHTHDNGVVALSAAISACFSDRLYDNIAYPTGD